MMSMEAYLFYIFAALILGFAGCQTPQERVQAPSTQHDLGDASITTLS